ncbi:hypothetical protein [Embleya sp. NBC_00896]|uniref:hypothetical protein n=1 Tax=Embleya sp. NBC_00896 TaxID=2975961 RepID=UPI00386E5679|nr:hypothetical protein OG928_32330 [Embleya sp. NBC_00896]
MTDSNPRPSKGTAWAFGESTWWPAAASRCGTWNQGWSARGGLFGTWFTPELAADYEVPSSICYEDETGMPSTAYQAAWDSAHDRIVGEMPQRARDACAWAEASGWRPEPPKVLEILLADRIESAEHHFFELLRAMGLQTADA